MTLTIRRVEDGHELWLDNRELVGRTIREYPPSHIRRGRRQASPWFRAQGWDGREAIDLGLFQSRREAVDAITTARRRRPEPAP